MKQDRNAQEIKIFFHQSWPPQSKMVFGLIYPKNLSKVSVLEAEPRCLFGFDGNFDGNMVYRWEKVNQDFPDICLR
jgi:hypothetical protein